MPLQHDFIENENNKPTIQDLYYSSDMVSFLTSYDYDSNGIAYGENGVITMKDVRPLDNQLNHYQDLSLNDAQQAWFYSIKDYITGVIKS